MELDFKYLEKFAAIPADITSLDVDEEIILDSIELDVDNGQSVVIVDNNILIGDDNTPSFSLLAKYKQEHPNSDMTNIAWGKAFGDTLFIVALGEMSEQEAAKIASTKFNKVYLNPQFNSRWVKRLAQKYSK